MYAQVGESRSNRTQVSVASSRRDRIYEQADKAKGIEVPHLTNIFNLLPPAIPRPQISPQRPPKHLQQHLKANLRHERIVPPLAQLVPYKRVLGVRHLVKGEADALLVQRLPDQIPAGGRDVVVFLAEYLHAPSIHQSINQSPSGVRLRAREAQKGDKLASAKTETHHHELALDVAHALQAVVSAGAEGLGVYVRGEVAHGGGDALVECAAECQMPAQTHARCADAAVAGGEGEEGRDGESGVFVVRVHFLSTVGSQSGACRRLQGPGGTGRTFSILYLFPSSVPWAS